MNEIGITADDRVLDRRVPSDWAHVQKHPLRTVRPLLDEPFTVEKILDIPRQYRDELDQGTEGACVGFSQTWLMAILNRKLYDARRLYTEAQLIDEWSDTPPGEGTSVRAGFDVLRTKGHWRIYAGQTRAPKLEHGIEANKWATTVDEIRAAIRDGSPVNLGLNWYRQFSKPEQRPRLNADGTPRVYFGKPSYDYWIAPTSQDWGVIDGGHAITCVGASDKREALALCNTWGHSYPFIVWVPYESMRRLLLEDGEAGVVVDRG